MESKIHLRAYKISIFLQKFWARDQTSFTAFSTQNTQFLVWRHKETRRPAADLSKLGYIGYTVKYILYPITVAIWAFSNFDF